MTQTFLQNYNDLRRFLLGLVAADDDDVRLAARRELANLDREARALTNPPPGPSMTAAHRAQHQEQRQHLGTLIARGDAQVRDLSTIELRRMDQEAEVVYGYQPPNLHAANAVSRPAASRPASSPAPRTTNSDWEIFEDRAAKYMQEKRTGGMPVWASTGLPVRGAIRARGRR